MIHHPDILNRNKTALIVVDMQERFAPVIPDFEHIEKRIIMLVRGCRVLGTPIYYTEQYPKGLGRTIKTLRAELGDVTVVEKMRFSIAGEDALIAALKENDILQIILVGIETHVCVLQSALDLIHLGYNVHVIGDATGSRISSNRDAALERMRQSGVTISVAESTLFELAEISGTDEFKQLSRLVK